MNTNTTKNQSTETHTLDEAAELLRCSRRFLQMEAKRGKLRVLRLSEKCTRVRASDLAAYLESHSNN